MFCAVVVLLIIFASGSLSGTDGDSPLTFTIPEPLIEALKPRGLRVSIPHTPGVQLFAFHGNINEPMDQLEAGQLSQDVVRKKGDHWVFHDRRVRLKPGDKIYYWLFVIRDNLGYRYDNGEYVVSELQEATVAGNDATRDPINKMDQDLRICERVVLNLTQTLLTDRYQIEALTETNNILKKLIGSDPETATSLTLNARIQSEDDLLTTVQDVIKHKLNLAIRAKAAVRNNKGGISFEVDTLEDKIAIIRAAKEKLAHSKFTITY